MWTKWFPWRFIVRNIARKQGFLDPVALMSRLQRFAQPSEIAAPTELLRSGAILHARGLMNSQAIQHNLDWIWPFWVERQFNPVDLSFVPRAFSITHINLTHRNWTAVGIPDTEQWPIVDPRGLVTPFHDSWSVDCWIVGNDGESLFPSRIPDAIQRISTEKNLVVTTEMKKDGISLKSEVQVVGEPKSPVCQIKMACQSNVDTRLVVSLRPYNPEGVSFIHDITWRDNIKGWRVNDEHTVYFNELPGQAVFSDYSQGDVFSCLPVANEGIVNAAEGLRRQEIHCEVGMATAAAMFHIPADQAKTVTIHIPLVKKRQEDDLNINDRPTELKWEQSSRSFARLSISDGHFQFLYDNAIRTLILHSPRDVYPGPFTYKRFWFRDAAFILNTMLCAGLIERAEHVVDRFPERQKKFGYFLSQAGEWDSNGEALWTFQRFCQLANCKPKPRWKEAIYKGGLWISRKRLPLKPDSLHAGLLPPGFSAEHLGPNNYYYWDNYWGVAGLKAAGFLADAFGDQEKAEHFKREAQDYKDSIEQSLRQVEQRLGQATIPASPYRRMDAGAIGSLVADYPLQIYPAGSERMKQVVDFLIKNCFIHGGFFQDMTHSGINPYLTLHIAQALMRAGDPRYFELMTAVADLASPTGQWPEAVHPLTGGGCMGDGQHVWAAAEWVMMIRNCFVREEEDEKRLILCSGIPDEWIKQGHSVSFGPSRTSFGEISISAERHGGNITVSWDAAWFADEPGIDIGFPGRPRITAQTGQSSVVVENGARR